MDETVSSGAARALVAGVAVTVLLWLIPGGGWVGYPLMLLSTVPHELGHGLTAALAGAHFDELRLYSNGSGVAMHHGRVGDLARGLISAGGLVGPACAAAIGFACARRPKVARIALGVVGGAFLLAVLLVVRGAFGMIFVTLVGAALVAASVWWQGARAQGLLAFLCVQLALSVYSRGDYLFVKEAHTGAGVLPSDVAQMASAWGGTYWLWGAVCAAFSAAVLLAGLHLFLKGVPLRRAR